MALEFDGSTQAITIPQAGDFPLYKNDTTYSICGWIRAPAQNEKIIWCEGESSSANALISLGSAKISPYKKLRVFIRNSTNTIFLDGVVSTTDVFDDTWHHFCWVDNNGTATLYIDGIADATNFNYTRSGTFNTLYTSIMVSARSGAWGAYADGIIFDFRCYNRCLSANEIAEICHRRGADKVWQGLVGWWRLDDLPSGTPAPLLLDAMDATTGWTPVHCTVSLNSTTYQQGSGAINHIKAQTTSKDCYAEKTISRTNLTGQTIKIDVYIKDSATLAKINRIELYLFAPTYPNLYNYQYSSSNLNVGWNTLSIPISSFSTSGTPDKTNIQLIRFDADSVNVTDTWSEGDVIFDFYRAGNYPYSGSFQIPDLSGNGNHGTPYNSPVYQASPHRLRRGVLVS